MLQAYQNRCRPRKDKILGSTVVICKRDPALDGCSTSEISRLDEPRKSARWYRLSNNEIRRSKKRDNTIIVGDRVQILEGDDKNKTGLVLRVLDSIVQVVVDDRDKKARFFKAGSVRTCPTAASTHQETTNTTFTLQEARQSLDSVRSPPGRQSSNLGSAGDKNALYKQSSLIDQLESKHVVNFRVNSLLEDLVEDPNHPPVRYVSFENNIQSIVSTNLDPSHSNDSTLSTRGSQYADHGDHLQLRQNVLRREKRSGPFVNGAGRKERAANEPRGRTLDPPVIDPVNGASGNAMSSRIERTEHKIMVGGTVQVLDGVHKGRNARVAKVAGDLVQVQIGSQAKVFLSPALLKVLPDPPSSLDQLWCSI